MHKELEEHYPSSDINIIAINEFDEGSANATAAATGDLALLQDIDGDSDGNSDTWESWGAEWRDVRIIDNDGELAADVMNLTNSANDLTNQEPYDRLKGMIVSVATANRVAQTPWQNRVEPHDVTNDGFVSPADVLANVREINDVGARELGTPSGEVTLYHDVNGDGFIAPNDVLWQVTHLNRKDNVGSGEPPASQAATEAVFASFAAYEAEQDEDE